MAVALAETMTESGHYDIDSTTVRAHVSAAGGKEGFINETLGRARGGFTSKIKPPAPEVFGAPAFAAWPAALPQPAPPATLA
jgi:hypothetical protein